MTSNWPPNVVDHTNLNGEDNRWTNLRLATYSQNAANSFARPSNVPLKGVTLEKRTGRYFARIKINYQNIHLGTFDTAEEAHAAYVAAAQKYFGEFARSS